MQRLVLALRHQGRGQRRLHRQQIRLDGTPADVRAFPDWFAWSPMADAVRTVLATPVAQGQVRPWETTAPQPAGERSQSRLRE
jgi:hypothetical protein